MPRPRRSYHNGELGELVRGERRVLERRRGVPTRVVLDAEDDRGRSLLRP
ncbi:hypothetical protein [Parafrankia soli]|nr:hypothetical protein [Parafrankia soli]